ncbi:MAG: PEP-CTERM sorting domain-containing protein [Planctomycetaceae bacterium]|nr:PEP-CTERM sorting domain-containing protein [Planctomycetaceae bacterium]
MKKVFWSLVLLLATPVTSAQADVFSYNFTPGTVTTTVSTYSIDTTGATGRARAFYITGDWSVAGGDPFSNEFRAQLVNVTNQGGGALDRLHGGLGNGNPHSFGAPISNTWSNNTTSPAGLGYNTFLADIAAADLGGTMTLGLRQTFAGSSANLANAQVHFLTDVIAPVAVNTTTSGTSMGNRPNGLTTLFGAGTFNYQALTFTAQATGAHHIGLRTGGQDGYLFAYNGTFDPNNPLTNLIGLDDVGGLGDANSSSMFLGLTGGNLYTFVATHFTSGSNITNGSFSIAGPAAVPEPSSALLLGLFALTGMARRRR